MSAQKEAYAARVSSGVPGLDAVLGGGFFQGGIYIFAGRPGAGKTILANQLAFAHARNGAGRVVYATLLAETHGRLLNQLGTMSFYDPAMVGRDILYMNGLGAVLEGGLNGLLQLVRRMVRDHDASLLVLDGMVTASNLAPSNLDYKRFISELQTWVAMVGCTVVLLTSGGLDEEVAAEHTMVDGTIELSAERIGVRVIRRLVVNKFRGSGFIEGAHSYQITGDGLRVFRRFETRPVADVLMDATHELPRSRVSTGIPGLDELLGGGLVSGSTTLLLGPSGCGKTVAGLQFLADGARRGEPCLYFGFFEPPNLIASKGDRLGFGITEAVENDQLRIEWRRASETLIDALAEELLAIVQERKIRRVFLDGFAAMHSSGEQERTATVFAALVCALVAADVTMIVSEETRELFVQDVAVPTPNVSALFHNILFLRHVEKPGRLGRLVAVMKTRDSSHDRRIWELDILDGGIVVQVPYALGGRTLARGTVQAEPSDTPAVPAARPKRKTRTKTTRTVSRTKPRRKR